jgi:hypothetical protein
VTADELARDRARHVGHGEAAGLGRELRLQDHLEQQVAELLAERQWIAVVDRLEDLVGLLEQIGPQAHVRLLAVPRAAAGGAKPCHDVDEGGERLGHARIGHRGTVTAGARPVNDGHDRRAGLASAGPGV